MAMDTQLRAVIADMLSCDTNFFVLSQPLSCFLHSPIWSSIGTGCLSGCFVGLHCVCASLLVSMDCSAQNWLSRYF